MCEMTCEMAFSPAGGAAATVLLHAPCGPAGPWQPRAEERAAVVAAAAVGAAAVGGGAAVGIRSGGEGEDEVSSMGVGRLKALLDELGVDMRGLVEKADYRNAARKGLAERAAAAGPAKPAAAPRAIDASWRCSNPCSSAQ
jgi:hypothetical protein